MVGGGDGGGGATERRIDPTARVGRGRRAPAPPRTLPAGDDRQPWIIIFFLSNAPRATCTTYNGKKTKEKYPVETH